jgi:ligand-binding SRPBCC domain-containing protein
MAAYILRTKTTVPLDIKRVFAFFADARNLNQITPPWLHFTLNTDGTPAMRPGTLLNYRIRLHLIPVHWQTEITVWDPPKRFVDEQRRGPYHWWVHTHTFAEVEGGTEVEDEVLYNPRGGAIVHALFVKRDLRRIFRYRHRALREALGVPDDGVRARVKVGRSR